MIKLIFFIFIITIIIKIYQLKLIVDVRSFFKRGFKKRNERFGLHCYTGKQGTGKTYSSIKFCIDEKFRTGCKIITNVKSFKMFEDTIYMKKIEDIIDYCTTFRDNDENILIFYDEIFTIIEKGGKLSKEILSFISQMRKRGIIFVTTAQEWAEINITFRRYVRYQIDCKMIAIPLTRTAILYNAINDGDAIKWDNDLQEYIAPRIKTKISKSNIVVANSYDTYETIST